MVFYIIFKPLMIPLEPPGTIPNLVLVSKPRRQE